MEVIFHRGVSLHF
nr:unnamed protein product [Callosobruchus analis]